MEKGFLSPKGRGRVKGVKEKQSSVMDDRGLSCDSASVNEGTAANVGINMEQNSDMSSELNASINPSLVPNEASLVLPNEPIASTNPVGSGSNDNNKESGSYAKLKAI